MIETYSSWRTRASSPLSAAPISPRVHSLASRPEVQPCSHSSVSFSFRQTGAHLGSVLHPAQLPRAVEHDLLAVLFAQFVRLHHLFPHSSHYVQRCANRQTTSPEHRYFKFPNAGMKFEVVGTSPPVTTIGTTGTHHTAGRHVTLYCLNITRPSPPYHCTLQRLARR